MPRIRSIKPEFWISEDIASVCRDARLLFIGLWTFADDSGNGLASFKSLKMKVFPGDTDVTEAKIKRWLTGLSADLIDLYEVEGKYYYHVRHWNHQRIDKPQPPKYPSFSEHSKNGQGMFPPDSIGKDKIVKDASSFDDCDLELSTAFYDHMISKFPDRYKSTKDVDDLKAKGAETINKLIRIDGHTIDFLKDVLRFAINDDFWQGVVTSLPRLRTKKDGVMKFDNLIASYEKNKPEESFEEVGKRMEAKLANK